MGRRNESGKRLKCSGCGYVWLYTGNNAVTSCPRCGNRVRVFYPSKESRREPVDSFTQTNQLI